MRPCSISVRILRNGVWMESDPELIKPGNRVLYMYLDKATTEWCVKERCLPYNSEQGTLVNSSPPYLIGTSCHGLSSELNFHSGASRTTDHGEASFGTHFVAVLPSARFEKVGKCLLDTDGSCRLEFEVFARPHQADDLGAECFKYDIISVEKRLFRGWIEDDDHIGKTDWYLCYLVVLSESLLGCLLLFHN